MALTYTQITDFLSTVLGTVSGIGKIYPEPKDFETLQEVEDNCLSGTPAHLNVWFIRRPGVKNSLRFFDGSPVPLGNTMARLHTFHIDGYYGYTKDETPSTYLTTQNMITAILDAFQGKRQRAQVGDSALMLDTEDISVADTIEKFAGAYFAHCISFDIQIEEMYSTVEFI